MSGAKKNAVPSLDSLAAFISGASTPEPILSVVENRDSVASLAGSAADTGANKIEAAKSVDSGADKIYVRQGVLLERSLLDAVREHVDRNSKTGRGNVSRFIVECIREKLGR